MRELKFRIWNGAEMEYNVTVGKFGNFYVNPEKGDGLNPKDLACLTTNTTAYSDKVSVMQFTGQIDNNRKEIFEGDKVKFNDKYKGEIVGVIEWSPMASQWWIIWNDGASRYKPLEPDYGDEQTQCTYLEVIGHRYEPSQKTEA